MLEKILTGGLVILGVAALATVATIAVNVADETYQKVRAKKQQPKELATEEVEAK